MFKIVHTVLYAHAAIQYNRRRSGKRKLGALFFLEQWQRLIPAQRTAIDRHFAWIKRYFGANDFQSHTLLQTMQLVLLTYIAAVADALTENRYQRSD